MNPFTEEKHYDYYSNSLLNQLKEIHYTDWNKFGEDFMLQLSEIYKNKSNEMLEQIKEKDKCYNYFKNHIYYKRNEELFEIINIVKHDIFIEIKYNHYSDNKFEYENKNEFMSIYYLKDVLDFEKITKEIFNKKVNKLKNKIETNIKNSTIDNVLYSNIIPNNIIHEKIKEILNFLVCNYDDIEFVTINKTKRNKRINITTKENVKFKEQNKDKIINFINNKVFRKSFGFRLTLESKFTNYEHLTFCYKPDILNEII